MERIIIADCRADAETVNVLEKTGARVIPTMKLDCVYDSIASHADIQIYYAGNGRFICAPEVYDYYRKRMPDEIYIVKGKKPLGMSYPDDIAYNAAPVGGYVICNRAHTAEEVIKAGEKKVLNVRQGYAKCSVCVVSAGAVITADSGIAKTAEKAGIDVLQISEGNVALRGMNYGFIGGASGLIADGLLAFNGELALHPDGDRIKAFCKKHAVSVTELKKGVLTDIGSIIANI